MTYLSVGIREAKASLSRLLRIVEKGRVVVLTDRGKPVGKLVPMDSKALPLAFRIREMEEAGIIDPPVGKGPWRLPPAIPIEKGIAQGLLNEDRGNDS